MSDEKRGPAAPIVFCQPLPCPKPPVPLLSEKTNRLAEGCCSAINPCGHQQRDPTTICSVCAAAGAKPDASEEHRNKLYDKVLDLKTSLAAMTVERDEALARLEGAQEALTVIAHTFTEDSHGGMKTMDAGWYQGVARRALASKGGE